jgi:NAD(P)H-nitrite reductase large subunit
VKTLAVLLRTTDADRAAEAVRAAVGLTLRGDRVVVATGGAPAEALADPRVDKGLATLRLLGHAVTDGDGADVARTADAVEVWT